MKSFQPVLPPGATTSVGSYSRTVFGSFTSVSVVSPFSGSAGDLVQVTVSSADAALPALSVSDTAGTQLAQSGSAPTVQPSGSLHMATVGSTTSGSTAAAPAVFTGSVAAAYSSLGNTFTATFQAPATNPSIQVHHWGTT